MIFRGTVSDRLEAVLRFWVRGPLGAVAEFDAVIDTGYTGLLTLPIAAAESLGLERGMGGQATLADGSARRFDTFAAQLEWCGDWRDVIVSAIGAEVLIGMRLLAGHELRVQVPPGGRGRRAPAMSSCRTKQCIRPAGHHWFPGHVAHPIPAAAGLDRSAATLGSPFSTAAADAIV